MTTKRPRKRAASAKVSSAARPASAKMAGGTGDSDAADARERRRDTIIIIAGIAVTVVCIIAIAVMLAGRGGDSNKTSVDTGSVIEDYSIEEDAGGELQALWEEYEAGELAASELMSGCYTLYNTDEITIDELATVADMLGEEVDAELIK